MALYPPRTLCEQLLLPLLNELEQRWQGQFGAQMERVFFLLLAAQQVRRADLPQQPPVARRAAVAGQPVRPAAGATPVAQRLAGQQRRLPGGSVRLAVAHRRTGPGGGASATAAVLLYSSKALHLAQLPKLLSGISCPTLIAGPTVCIHQAELAVLTPDTPELFLAEDPVSAHQLLIQRGLI